VRAWWVAVLACAGVVAASGGVGDWKAYTAKHDIRDLAWDDSRQTVWVVTGGGMYSYRDADGSFSEFTTSEGLRTNDLTAVVVDHHGTVWAGASNGFLHRYHPSTGSWEYVTDIYSKQVPQKGINRLEVAGDTLYILSDIGVSVFSIPRMEFADTYGRFGSGPAAIDGSVTDFALFGGRYWVATRSGIASTPVSNPNPSSPESWQVSTTLQGLPSNRVNRLAPAPGSLFAATSAGLAVLSDSGWSLVAGTAGTNVADASSGKEPCIDCQGLYFISGTDLLTYSPAGGVQPVASGFQSTLVVMGGNRFLGTLGGLVIFRSNFTPLSITPPGPPSNEFVGLAVDRNGVVWSGTGISGGTGFMSFDGKLWRSYTVQQDPRLGSNNYYKVSLGANGAKWVSNWGQGIALVDDGGTVRKVLNGSNGLPSSIPVVPPNPPFVVTGGAAVDQSGATWITVRTPPGDTALFRFNPDSSLSYITGLVTRNPVLTFSHVVIDFYGTKWLGNYDRFEPFVANRGTGFYYYNESGQIPGTVNGWGRLTTSDGLTSDRVYSLAVDHDGDLWIGTDQGITIIFDPSDPPHHVAPYYPPVRDQLIQAIVVDPLNNKWVGTRQGVFVFSPDGTSILAHYTADNTGGKLLDDDVASVAIDPRSGTMYFGTEKGLSSLGTAAVSPKTDFEELSFAPNPYYIPSTRSLTVDGLIAGSSLKILSANGRLIREVSTPGGRVGFWDGRDAQGRLVSTGVYLVVAFSDAGSEVASGKVAVIRR
jgi:ligand-binding sensor domain-containing protein